MFKKPFWKKSRSSEELKDERDDTQREKQVSKSIESRMKQEEKKQESVVSLLLLGAGGSGKSTVLKQMEKIYNGNIEEKHMDDAKYYIRANIIEDILELCRCNKDLREEFDECYLQNDKAQKICDELVAEMHHTDEIELNPKFAGHIRTLWKDPGMKATFERRKLSHIMDNTPYFFRRVREIAKPEYVATFEDYVRVRHRTTGIIHAQFNVQFQNQDWIFQVTDVGGQRTERRKWIHVFADVNAVIYVMSLSAYDQVLFEDHSTRCWDETLSLFQSISSLKVFRHTDFIIFLNKSDLFMKKIEKVPFTAYDPNCGEELKHNAEKVITYIQKKFEEAFAFKEEDIKMDRRNNASRAAHFHVTCATDTKQISAVMGLIQFEAVRGMMKRSALM